MHPSDEKLSEIRVIVAHAVGLTSADMADDVDLLTTFAASWSDLFGAIANIDAKYRVNVPPDELGESPTVRLIYEIVARQKNWPPLSN